MRRRGNRVAALATFWLESLDERNLGISTNIFNLVPCWYSRFQIKGHHWEVKSHSNETERDSFPYDRICNEARLLIRIQSPPPTSCNRFSDISCNSCSHRNQMNSIKSIHHSHIHVIVKGDSSDVDDDNHSKRRRYIVNDAAMQISKWCVLSSSPPTLPKGALKYDFLVPISGQGFHST